MQGIMRLHVDVKTSFAGLKPYVFDTPIGSQMRQRKKSSIMRRTEKRKNLEYIRGGR
jgi:hypothetical protein